MYPIVTADSLLQLQEVLQIMYVITVLPKFR